MDMTSVFAEITKTAPQDDGSLFVFGKATGSDLDLDQQRCDPDWLKRAMPDWFSGAHGYGGNIREQHDSRRAIGKATDHEVREDGHYIRAHIVDPVAVAKTKAGIFSGFSIGIQKPRLEKTGGQEWIRDGSICEISLVDRPALPTATLTVCKTAKPGMQIKAVDFDSTRMLVKCEELAINDDSVEKSADVDTVTLSADEAPVEVEETKSGDVTDEATKTMDAIVDAGQEGLDTHSPSKLFVGLGKSTGESMAKGIEPEFDVEQAKALVAALAGKSGEEALKAANAILNKTVANADAGLGQDESGDINGALQAISIIADLIQNEAQALGTTPAQGCDIDLLMQAVHALRIFNCREAKEQAGIDPGPAPIMLSADPDVEKAKYSAEELRQMLKDGKAFRNPDGEPSYPIGDKDDLSKAIKAVGRGSGDHDSIRAFIQKRAKALGASNMIPDDWSTDGSNKTAEADNKTSAEEAVEKTVTVENSKAATVEADPESLEKALVALLEKAMSSDVEKSDNPLRKSLSALVRAETEELETATKTAAESVSDLTERLVKVESMAVPGGPALRRTEVERTSARKNDLIMEAARFKALAAANCDDPNLRKGYDAKATQLEAEIRAL